MQLERIRWDEADLASRRVIEKNGFEPKGVLRRAVCKGGEVYDLLIYGRLR